MKLLCLALLCLFTFSVSAAVAQQVRTIRFDENRGKGGFAVGAMSAYHVDVTFRLEQVKVEGNVMQQISNPGVILPNDEDAPNMPGLGRHVAVPRGAMAEGIVVQYGGPGGCPGFDALAPQERGTGIGIEPLLSIVVQERGGEAFSVNSRLHDERREV